MEARGSGSHWNVWKENSDMINTIRRRINDSIAVKQLLLEDTDLLSQLEALVQD